MNHFDAAAWSKVLGDVLIILCYILGPVFFALSGFLMNDPRTDKEPIVALFFGFMITALAHLISAGGIK